MSQKEKKIFISYCWKDTKIVDEIDSYFSSIGLTLTRDKRALKFKSSIKEFMQQVSKTDFVIMVISDAFLKSKNCMYEVLELVKDQNFQQRLLQIILPDAKYFSTDEKLKYLDFWNAEFERIKAKQQNSDPLDTGFLVNELRHLENIKRTIGEFLDILSDENSISYQTLKESNYKQIIDFIGYSSVSLTGRPKSLICHPYYFQIEQDKWLVLVGIHNSRPVEIFCDKEPFKLNIDFQKEVRLVLNKASKGFDRIDLVYYDIEGYKITVEGMNRFVPSKDTSIFTRIINIMLASNTDPLLIKTVLNEMYTPGYENPYLWKNEIIKVISNYEQK